jgi:hypothetical protein
MLSTGGQVEPGPQGLRKASSAPGQLERETCSMSLFTPGHASDLCGASALAPQVNRAGVQRPTRSDILQLSYLSAIPCPQGWMGACEAG